MAATSCSMSCGARTGARTGGTARSSGGTAARACSRRGSGPWRRAGPGRAGAGARYPAGWALAVPGEGIRVVATPEVAAAENVSALAGGISYWEGPVRLTDGEGRDAGEGYVELTGYGEGTRPPL